MTNNNPGWTNSSVVGPARRHLTDMPAVAIHSDGRRGVIRGNIVRVIDEGNRMTGETAEFGDGWTLRWGRVV